MTQAELLRRISIDPNICFGKPCIKGHRIWVSLILDLLASGATADEIVDQYPQLTREDVLACIAYGSEMSRERYVDIPGRQACVKFELDENLNRAAAALLCEAALDVVTVSDQGLEGARDPDLIDCCVPRGTLSHHDGCRIRQSAAVPATALSALFSYAFPDARRPS